VKEAGMKLKMVVRLARTLRGLTANQLRIVVAAAEAFTGGTDE
jgi:hypothetical protein